MASGVQTSYFFQRIYLAIENANNSYQVAQLRKVGRHYVILGADDKYKGDQTEVYTVAFMAP